MIEKYNNQQNKNGAAWLLTKQLVSWIQVTLIPVDYPTHPIKTPFSVTTGCYLRIVFCCRSGNADLSVKK